MDGTLDVSKIEAVFQSRPDIIKRRKLAGDQQGNGAADGQASAAAAADEAALLEIKEISVAIPQRKKLELCFTANHLYARAPGTTAPIPGISYAWKDIEFAFYLPVPDKAQVQHNYILFPRGTCLPSKAGPTPAIEPLVFTVPSTPPKQGTIGGSEAVAASTVSASYKALLHWALGKRFTAMGSSVQIVSAERSNFQSVIRQPLRPNEKAVHVNGFRGSKDGHLFFLENGLLWGFKKPLIFIPMDRIAAVSFTNVLTVTFNMVVEVFAGDGDATEEFEFGMLDQQDYRGIDNYVRLNRLQDRSMAEQRKGKLQLAENKGPKKKQQADELDGGGEAMATDDQPDDGLTELERAQREAEQKLQDEEDEEEEDYDPGSDDDSDGSGSSSDEDSDDDDEGGEAANDDDDDAEDAEDEGGDDDDEGGEDREEMTEKMEVKVEAKPPAARVRAPQATIKKEEPRIPVRTGWASLNIPSAGDDIDMEEKFDVVG
ncbi:Histone chaperone [Escovopsis weberi]|uniref:Histone chaperone n=1 Tax=Escovopsis weberi TaxID=150374 RepID=A0A0M8N5E9_ESCWE|nr:Histone chaperone [Escovopsis weberi]